MTLSLEVNLNLTPSVLLNQNAATPQSLETESGQPIEAENGQNISV